MEWQLQHIVLRDHLAVLYHDWAAIKPILDDAGFPTHNLRPSEPGRTLWHAVLHQLVQAGNGVLLDSIVRRATKDWPNDPILNEFLAGRLRPVVMPDLGAVPEPRALRTTLEKITGQRSTLLPISFLETGVRASRAVCRIVLADQSSGSGFLIRGNWVVTNHHVINGAPAAKGARAEFNFQTTPQGRNAQLVEFRFDSAHCHTDAANDWTFVRLMGDANAEFGALAFSAADASAGDCVNIVQHPGGGPKQIGLYHNIVAYASSDHPFIQYLTDTLPGSSGSPVFNNQWEVVAVHHAGGELADPGGKGTFLRNEGIRSAILRVAIDRLGIS